MNGTPASPQHGPSHPPINRSPFWTFLRICERFPKLEYLFGAFFLRYWRTAQTDPTHVLEEYICKNPAALEQTCYQLSCLLEYCTRQAQPEDYALEFLEELGCPYYPPYNGGTAITWLRHIHTILSENGRPLALATEIDSQHEPLDLPELLDAPALPLHLVYALLASYDIPLEAPALLNSPTFGLATIRGCLVEPKPLAKPNPEPPTNVIPLLRTIQPLKDVSACRNPR